MLFSDVTAQEKEEEQRREEAERRERRPKVRFPSFFALSLLTCA